MITDSFSCISILLSSSCVSIFCLYGFRRLEYSASCVSSGSKCEGFCLESVLSDLLGFTRPGVVFRRWAHRLPACRCLQRRFACCSFAFRWTGVELTPPALVGPGSTRPRSIRTL
jgi:hypothetical protein